MQVTIVLPCFNAERHLDRCLASLFAQTHDQLDLIAIDDGSSDGTFEMLQAARARSPFPMTVLGQANAGACAARNKGLQAASGEYIQFMDADDALLPEKIAHHLRCAESNDWPGIVVGSATLHAPDGTKSVDQQRSEARDPWLDLAAHRMGGTPNNLWQRDAVVRAGGWDESLKSSQEYDLMFRMVQLGARIAYDPEPLTEVHLQASGSVSTTNLAAKWKRYIDLRRRIIAHVEQNGIEHNSGTMRQALFDAIRILYPHDPDGAESLYAQCFPNGYKPARSAATGAAYVALHKLLGFRLANRIARALRPAASAAS